MIQYVFDIAHLYYRYYVQRKDSQQQESPIFSVEKKKCATV